MPLSRPALALLLLACGEREPDAALLARSLDPGLPVEDALEACEPIREPAIRDECLAGVVRARTTLPDPLSAEACHSVEDARWSGECWFTLAERRLGAGDRWGALEGCGRAGPFYDECLYHLWTGELGAVARAAPDAISAVEPAREIVAFWSGIETVSGDPQAQLWGDLWFFAWNEHRPADIEACERLPEAPDRARCREGTRIFVLRALMGELLSPGAPQGILDRTCRSAEVPESFRQGLYLPHPELDALLPEVVALSCKAAKGEPVRRWNPVFRSRRGSDGGKPGGEP